MKVLMGVLVSLLPIAAGCTQTAHTFGSVSAETAPLPRSAPKGHVTLGYLPDYRAGISVDAAQYYTHVAIFSLGILPNGDLDRQWCPDALVAKAKGMRDTHKVKILVSVGGFTRSGEVGKPGGFLWMVQHPEVQARFIQNVVAFCSDNGFHGVDYDWEDTIQGHASELSQLIKDTAAAFDTEGHHDDWLVTAALAPWQEALPKDTFQYVNLVGGMFYDYDKGPHSTYVYAQKSIDELAAKNVPLSKLLLGTPFYAHPAGKLNKAKTFAELADKIKPASDAIVADGITWHLNGPATLRKKAKLAKTKSLAGVMVWEIGQDTPDFKASRALTGRA